MAVEVRTCEDILDHVMRVPVPDVILPSHPLWRASRFRKGTIVSEAGVLPRNVTELNRVDLLMKILVVGDGGRVIMGNKCSGPQFEELVMVGYHWRR